MTNLHSHIEVRASAINPIFVTFGPTLVRTDASFRKAQRRVQADDAADVVPDSFDSLNRKRRSVRKLFAVKRIVSDRDLLRPRVDESEQRDLVVASSFFRSDVS